MDCILIGTVRINCCCGNGRNNGAGIVNDIGNAAEPCEIAARAYRSA
jgi:hypothetical protein